MISVRRQSGFTIVELLIVIVVIAILAAITIVAYTGIQDKARAVVMADGAQKVEQSLRLWLTLDGQTNWPSNDLYADPNGDGNNPTLDWMIKNTGLGEDLPAVPHVPGIDDSQWHYDWDNNPGDISDCVDPNQGVNVFVTHVPESIVQKIDDQLDDGNLACGKVRYVNYHGEEQFSYKLSSDGVIQ